MPLSWLSQEEQQILQQVLKDGPLLNEILTEVKAISLREERCCQKTTETLATITGTLATMDKKLDQLLQLIPSAPVPVGFNVAIETVKATATKKK